MTIKEFSQWAKKEHKEDYKIVIRSSADDEMDFYEPSLDDIFVWDSTKQVEI